MKISRIANLVFDEVLAEDLDVVVAASGYESRARTIASELSIHLQMDISIKCAWGFEEYANNKIRKLNDRAFKELGYNLATTSGNDGLSPERWITRVLEASRGRSVRILVDISSMTRTWYGGIVKALARAPSFGTVHCVFGYVPATWSTGSHPTIPNEIVGPVPGYASLALPNEPAVLVVGLGTDPDRALGLKDFLDPPSTVCFYASPGSDRRYERAAKMANSDLLRTTPLENVYRYNLFDVRGTFMAMQSVCQGLAQDYRVVLASLGPKIFGLCCVLLQTIHPEFSVWRVSPGTRLPPTDHQPGRDRIFVDIEWK